MADHPLIEQLDQAIDSVLTRNPAPATARPDLLALVEIATTLRDMPAEDFKTRLKTELERRAFMPTATATGFRTITPFIIHAEAPKLVDFLTRTFRAEEIKRNNAGDPNGFYSEVRIGDSTIMIAGGVAAQRGNLPAALHVFVPDCDAAYRRALDAGATTLMGAIGEPADRPYGERSAYVEDAFGNYWYIATRLRPVARAEDPGTVVPHVHPTAARKYIDFLQRAFGAEEITVIEQAGRVMHAAIRVRGAVLEMGEPDDRTHMPTNGFFLFVDDVEKAYEQALAAGATAIRPPGDLPAGMRSAIVRDPEGYLWWPARWT